MRTAVLVGVLLLATPARADTHGDVAVGGGLLVTGNAGDLTRGDVEVDIEPGGAWRHYGVIVGLHDFDAGHAGLLCAGVLLDAAVARPRLVLQLHADLGIDLDVDRPVVGGGLRALLGIAGPIGVVVDTNAYVVLDGVGGTRLAIGFDLLAALRW